MPTLGEAAAGGKKASPGRQDDEPVWENAQGIEYHAQVVEQPQNRSLESRLPVTEIDLEANESKGLTYVKKGYPASMEI